MRLLKKRKILKPVELWDNIDEMWLHNWEQLNLTGNLKHLIKRDRDKSRKVNPKLAESAYFRLHDQYAERTGSSDVIEKYRVLVIKLIEARAKVHKDRSQMNWIRHYEDMIAQLMNSGEGYDMIKNRLAAEKIYGQRIDPRKRTVGEFLRIVELLNEQQHHASANKE